ncbi:hypothetical protein AB0L82_32135 [Nocardia sp. NPDC052001]|uniref:hypothetical protein n=1 Tax=unclassified Nocardia TaxID=2637762 RepID=UPI003414D9D4
MSTRYQFVVEGELSDRALAAFPDLSWTPPTHGTTTLFGAVTDATAMRGILARLDNLGLTLLEMRQLPD